MAYRIIRTNGRLMAGNGARIEGKYALFHGEEFIHACNDKEELRKYALTSDITDETGDEILLNTCIILVIIILFLIAQPVADIMVPYG